MLPAARGRKPRSEGPGAAATPIAASPARRLANQTPVRSTNQKERWRAGAEERTERESGRRWEEGAGSGPGPGPGGEGRGGGRAGSDHVPPEQRRGSERELEAGRGRERRRQGTSWFAHVRPTPDVWGPGSKPT